MSQSENSSRWWEFYVVRYGMGAVVGGVIFFFLCNSNPVLKPMLFGAEAGKIDGPLLALFVGYGLAYCYIASAPILVLHAGRFLLNISQNALVSWRRVSVSFVPPVVATFMFFLACKSTGSELYFLSFVFLLAAMVFWIQCLAIFFTLSRRKELLNFYDKLAEKRKLATGGIVDSYKHLREHGNSFFIVTLEVILAIILFTVGNFDTAVGAATKATKVSYVLPYIWIILIWILPAALVWLVGTVIERQFCDS